MRSSTPPKILLLAFLCLLFVFAGLGYAAMTLQKPLGTDRHGHQDKKNLAAEANALSDLSAELLALQADFQTRMIAHHTSQAKHIDFINGTLVNLTITISTCGFPALDTDFIKQTLFSSRLSRDHRTDIKKVIGYLEQKIGDDQQVDFGAVMKGIRDVIVAAERMVVEMEMWEAHVEWFRGRVEELFKNLKSDTANTSKGFSEEEAVHVDASNPLLKSSEPASKAGKVPTDKDVKFLEMTSYQAKMLDFILKASNVTNPFTPTITPYSPLTSEDTFTTSLNNGLNLLYYTAKSAPVARSTGFLASLKALFVRDAHCFDPHCKFQVWSKEWESNAPEMISVRWMRCGTYGGMHWNTDDVWVNTVEWENLMGDIRGEVVFAEDGEVLEKREKNRLPVEW